jgi:FkbM family methyltransferase
MRSLLVKLGYAALKAGFNLPHSSFIERFSEQAYMRDLIQKLDINVFIDVGASIGWYSRHFRMMGYDKHLLSFEPVPEDYASLSKMAAGDPLWQTFNMALGRKNGTAEFNVIRSSDSGTVYSSFLTSIDQEIDRVENVQVKRLDEVLDEALANVKNPRIFLKVDTQGYDLEVFAGIEKHMVNVVGMQSEISVDPIYEGMPHYTQALEHYESLGFSLMNLFIVNRTDYKGILEYDCVMARKDELLKK